MVGVVGFAIKHNIDRIVATAFFNRRFTPWNYWSVPIDALRIDLITPADRRFIITLAVISLPFIWMGLALTMRRLRSAGLPLWLAILFFLPFGNLLFFVVLSLIPERSAAARVGGKSASPLGSIIPRDPLGSSAVAVVLTGAIGALATFVGVQKLGTYGWGVFVALPFCCGLFSILIYGYHERRALNSCIVVSMISIGLVALALFAFAIEGIVCIVMALPIAAPLAMLGGIAGYFAQRHPSMFSESPTMTCLLLLFPVALMSSETIRSTAPPLVSVRTSIRIEAPAEKVWTNLIAFPDVADAPSGFFRWGVSYPIHAVIRGRGVGAVRECLFSTGTFVEKINVWEEGKRLGFEIVDGPEGMRELSPYEIHPRHLHDYFVPESAEFRLSANADGSTQLEGTSWYRNSMWPSAYWRVWSDAVLHQVHLRVFEHIKTLSETEKQAADYTDAVD
jgi:hypothetical protein